MIGIFLVLFCVLVVYKLLSQKKGTPKKMSYTEVSKGWRIAAIDQAARRWSDDFKEAASSMPYPYKWYWQNDGSVIMTLSTGVKKKGSFITDTDQPYIWPNIIGFRTDSGEIMKLPKKEIPTEAHVKVFVGALSQPSMSSDIEALRLELAGRGKVTADVTKLNGITEDRYMSEFFRQDMKIAWGDALLEVLQGAADRFKVNKEKPYLITLYAPKEPK